METFKVEIEISPKKIASLLCTGFEGGYTSFRIMDTHAPERKPAPILDMETDAFGVEQLRKGGRIWPAYDYPVQKGATFVRDTYAEGEDDENYKTLVLDGAAILRGLKIMAEKYPKHFADFMTGNDDAITGDVFLQCCLLGEIVYG